MNRLMIAALSAVTFLASLSAARAEKYALFVGVSEMKNVPKNSAQGGWLSGPHNDLPKMRLAFQNVYGFKPQNIVTLEKTAASRAGIEREFRNLIRKAGPNDLVVFYYSGHGTQVPDVNGDEADGKDEALCPYDMGSTLDTFVTDDDLGNWVSQFRTKNVFIMLDSCHSGTGLRGGDVPRALEVDVKVPRNIALSTQKFSRAKSDTMAPDGSAPVLLSGCRADQTSSDSTFLLDGKDKAKVDAFLAQQKAKGKYCGDQPINPYMGALTFAFLGATYTKPAGSTYEEIHRETALRLQKMKFEQEPQLEGNALQRPALDRIAPSPAASTQAPSTQPATASTGKIAQRAKAISGGENVADLQADNGETFRQLDSYISDGGARVDVIIVDGGKAQCLVMKGEIKEGEMLRRVAKHDDAAPAQNTASTQAAPATESKFARRAKVIHVEDDFAEMESLDGKTFDLLESYFAPNGKQLTVTTAVGTKATCVIVTGEVKVGDVFERKAESATPATLPQNTAPLSTQPTSGWTSWDAKIAKTTGNTVTIEAPLGFELTAGSIFQSESGATLRLTSSSGTTASASLLNGSVKAGDKLRETFHFVNAAKLRVAILGNSPSREELKKRINALNFAQVVDAKTPHEAELEFASASGISLKVFRNQQQLPTISGSDLDDAFPRVGRALENMYTVNQLVQLDNSKSKISVDLQVNGRDFDTVKIGDTISFTARANRDCYLYLVDVDPVGKVTVLFPNKYAGENKLRANQTTNLPAPNLYRLRVAGPAGSEAVKAIVTEAPMNLEVLQAAHGEIAALSGGGASIAGELLAQLKRELNKGARGIEVLPAEKNQQPITTEGWGTDMAFLTIK